MTELSAERRDRLLKQYGIRPLSTPCGRRFRQLISAAAMDVPTRDLSVYEASMMESSFAQTIQIGRYMEENTELVSRLTEEAEKARDQLLRVINDMHSLDSVLIPKLAEYNSRIRDMRMSVARETHEILTTLRELRAFVSTTEYEQELQRISRWVAVAREFAELKASGVLDVIVDMALRLEEKA